VDGDIQPIWEVVLQMRFYASPVLFVATLVPGERIYLCNPIASILTEMRRVMMDPHAAGAAEAIGGAERLPIPLGIIAFVFAMGCFVFRREGAAGRENL
jgi:ABC-2 type transport system permease protein